MVQAMCTELDGQLSHIWGSLSEGERADSQRVI